jgi:hypothetical protein
MDFAIWRAVWTAQGVSGRAVICPQRAVSSTSTIEPRLQRHGEPLCKRGQLGNSHRRDLCMTGAWLGTSGNDDNGRQCPSRQTASPPSGSPSAGPAALVMTRPGGNRDMDGGGDLKMTEWRHCRSQNSSPLLAPLPLAFLGDVCYQSAS